MQRRQLNSQLSRIAQLSESLDSDPTENVEKVADAMLATEFFNKQRKREKEFNLPFLCEKFSSDFDILFSFILCTFPDFI